MRPPDGRTSRTAIAVDPNRVRITKGLASLAESGCLTRVGRQEGASLICVEKS